MAIMLVVAVAVVVTVVDVVEVVGVVVDVEVVVVVDVVVVEVEVVVVVVEVVVVGTNVEVVVRQSLHSTRASSSIVCSSVLLRSLLNTRPPFIFVKQPRTRVESVTSADRVSSRPKNAAASSH